MRTSNQKLLRFLGPETKRSWAKVERFWENGELTSDDYASSNPPLPTSADP